MLKRGVTYEDNLLAWFLQCQDHAERKDISVELLGPDGKTVRSWQFLAAFPVKWQGPALNAASANAATETLEIAFEDSGPAGGPAVILLHGWPDDAQGWREVSPTLNAAGFRTVTPYLRGCGGTRFRESGAVRDGRAVALAQDAVDLADALHIETFAVAGHDWGARAAYTLAALCPGRLRSIAALAVGYSPRGEITVPAAFSQARRGWYQWFMATDAGAAAVRRDPRGFARIQWETWSPEGWFDGPEFDQTAASFDNPDWVEVTLNAYRSRWREEPADPRYAGLQAQLKTIATIGVPTLMIQGADDRCDPPSESEGQERCFRRGYRRVVWDGVGHFPAREVPRHVSRELLAHLKSTF